jgi:hypothetical protein
MEEGRRAIGRRTESAESNEILAPLTGPCMKTNTFLELNETVSTSSTIGVDFEAHISEL